MYSLEQVRYRVPSAFATEPYTQMSDNYAYIPTSSIISAMMDEGYGVSAAYESGTRIEEKRGHTKHLLRFRKIDQAPLMLGEILPEIVLVNSHDGSSAYRLMAGLLRLACTNGLMVADGKLGGFHVRHYGDVQGQVISGSQEMLKRLPETLDTVSKWRNIALDEQQALDFAKAALVLRYGEDEYDFPFDSPRVLLSVRRWDDRGDSLWNVFNRVQENIMKGGFRSRFSGRRTRAVRNIAENVRLNQGLWSLAQETAERVG